MPTVRPTCSVALVVVVLLISLGSGCVQRRMMIRSHPEGALVYLNGQELGRTPIATNFTYYGDFEVKLVKDGYETLTVMQSIPMPWYQIPPLDFVLSKSSWGVHYHLGEYWAGVAEKLKPDGFIILNFYVSDVSGPPPRMFANDYDAWLKDRGWELIKIGVTEANDLKIYKVQRRSRNER